MSSRNGRVAIREASRADTSAIAALITLLGYPSRLPMCGAWAQAALSSPP